MTFNSIVHTTGSAGQQVGGRYLNLTQRVGGLACDIESDDWSGLLDAPGVAAAGLERAFFPSSLPVFDPLDVRVVTPDEVTVVFTKGEDNTDGASRNSFVFDTFLQSAPSEAHIEYTVLAPVLH